MQKIQPAVLLFVFSVVLLRLSAQTRSEVGLIYNGAQYDVFAVKVNTHSLSQLHLVQNTSSLKHCDFIRQTIAAGDSDFFLINACISNATCSPEGLFVVNGKKLSDVNLSDGNGNFYLKPNGALLVMDNGTAVITESSTIGAYNHIYIGIQSGPMLLVNGNYNPQIRKGSPNKNLRSGVGLYTIGAETYMVFAVSNEPVSFHEFATLFKEHFNCQNALCLESAGCAMYLPFVGRYNSTDSHVICNYIMYKKE
jgi:uncharacterized protein YigE (DUF2233 family)